MQDSFSHPGCNWDVRVVSTTLAHLTAFTGVLKELRGEAGAIKGHSGFGVRARRRGAGSERQSVELLLQRQDDPITLKLRRVKSLSREQKREVMLVYTMQFVSQDYWASLECVNTFLRSDRWQQHCRRRSNRDRMWTVLDACWGCWELDAAGSAWDIPNSWATGEGRHTHTHTLW